MRAAVTAFPHTAQICDISSDRPPERDVFEEPESNSAAKIPMYGLPALLGRQTYLCNLHARSNFTRSTGRRGDGKGKPDVAIPLPSTRRRRVHIPCWSSCSKPV